MQDALTLSGTKVSDDGIVETFDNDDEALDAVDNGVVVRIWFDHSSKPLLIFLFCFLLMLLLSLVNFVKEMVLCLYDLPALWYLWIAWVHFSFTYYWVFKTWQVDAHAKSIDFYTLPLKLHYQMSLFSFKRFLLQSLVQINSMLIFNWYFILVTINKKKI